MPERTGGRNLFDFRLLRVFDPQGLRDAFRTLNWRQISAELVPITFLQSYIPNVNVAQL